MSVERLYVEGEADALLISKIASTLQGMQQPLITREGSKNSLKSKVIDARKRSRSNQIFFLRDRDFDFDMVSVSSVPQAVVFDNPPVIAGWHWCRHEIENYILDPYIISRVIPGTCPEAVCAALEEWFKLNGLSSPGAARHIIAHWMSEHPHEVLQILPEWQGLIQLLQTS